MDMPIVQIIEDDPLIQAYYQEVFLSEGYQVVIAGKGDEGLSNIKKHHPDILILDLAIPGTSGRALLSQLKKIAPTLPILIVSGRVGMQDDPEIQISPQVYRFFPKPINFEELRDTVRKILVRLTVKREKDMEDKMLGDYRLIACIGSGSSGSVYKAYKEMWADNVVAVKILPQNTLDFEELLARFHREVQLLQKISHPNVIKLLDVGYDCGLHYLVMEFFPGDNGEELIKRHGRLPAAACVKIIRQIAQGMAATHARALIHRDLKPSNILYNADTQVAKVIDFGLVRKIEDDGMSSVTQQGYIVGTPDYMSPEQCQGIPLDGRSDIYSLGASFYHMLTGKLPFHKSNVIQTFLAQVQEPLSWPAQTPSVPAQLCDIVNKMMAKNVKERYATMEEVFRDLPYV